MVNPFLNRREFIGATAVAGAGMLLNGCKSDSGQAEVPAKKSSQNDINIALIGYGEEGKVLLESLLNIEGVKLVALCDIWDFHLEQGARYLSKLGNPVNAYENYEDLLAKEKDLQAVVIATPDFWHAPMTNTCLKAGLHVYCEKMMSNTIEGARSMVKTMRDTGKLLQIGHQRRSNPRYVFTLNRLLHDAKFCGRLTAVQGQWNRAVKEDFGWPRKFEMPAGTLAKYGFVAEDTAHSHDGRERPWRATVTSLNVPDGTGSPAVRDAARLLTASVQAAADELRQSYRDRSGEYPEDWREALGTNYDVVHVTPEELGTLRARLVALFGEYRRLPRDERPPGARRVQVAVDLVPWFPPDAVTSELASAASAPLGDQS